MTIGYLPEAYDELYKTEQLNKLRIILDELSLEKSDKVLDLACGTGFTLAYYPCEVIGVEPQKSLFKNSKIIEGFAENIPLRDNEVDFTIILSAIHHFNIDKAFKEIKRVTKKGVVFSIVKGLSSTNFILKQIKKSFKVIKEINEQKDFIFFCKF